MSHFTTLVVTRDDQDVETQLAPFDENLVMPATDEDEIDLGDLAANYDAMAERTERPEHREDFLAKAAEIRDGRPERALDDYFGDGRWRETFDGRYLEVSTYNPQSKWDWWTVGGRWSDQLITKDGKRADTARLVDLDMDAMKAEALEPARAALATLDAAVAAHGPLPSRDWVRLEGEEFEAAKTAFWDHPTVRAADLGVTGRLSFADLDAIETDRDAWLERQGWIGVLGFALLAHTGDWLEEGRMGWFGMSSSTAESVATYVEVASSYLTGLLDREDADEFTVTLCDLHI